MSLMQTTLVLYQFLHIIYVLKTFIWLDMMSDKISLKVKKLHYAGSMTHLEICIVNKVILAAFLYTGNLFVYF